MRTQTYYNAPLERMANVCDMTKELCVNCVGAVENIYGFTSRSVRKDYYLMYMISGSMDIQFGSVKGVISSGDLLIMKPETEYMYHTEKGDDVNYLWMHFTGNKAQKMIEDASIPINSICKCGQTGSVVDLFKRMFQEFILNDEHFTQMTTSLFTEILTLFSRRINSTGEERLFKSILYIHENYAKKININFLASLENLSESHYRAVFSHVFGKSPIEYITARRIEAAIYLLENSDKKLTEISSLAGYNDVYYFSRQFKKITGISPGKYRKNRQS